MQLQPLSSEENDLMSDDEGFDERDYLLENLEPSVRVRLPSFAYRNMGVVNSLKFIFCCGCCSLWRKCFPKREPRDRQIIIGEPLLQKFSPNVIRNQKYTIFTFLPLVLYDQFKFFLNFYFLVMAMSQFVPELQVGLLYTYWGPLGFVITATVMREAIDDLRRWRRDKEVNGQKYSRLVHRPEDGSTFSEFIPSSDITVGDLIVIEKDQRVPADLLLLRTTDKTGSCFIRTDQLDGETDWKMRTAISVTQKITEDSMFFENKRFRVFAEKPMGDIHSFIGTLSDEKDKKVGLNIENTLWANTVLTAGTALGLVVYTGKETRSCMNNSQPRSKTGLLDLEINTHTKILFFAVIGLALLMMCLKGFNGPVFGMVYMFRFVLLFSYIIPLSLRLNLDFAKIFYSYQMSKDKKMPGCVVRCTTIPEELGRISYLLSDKTGTLTKNSMIFKNLHMGPRKNYSIEDNDVIRHNVEESFASSHGSNPVHGVNVSVKGQFSIADAVLALAVCHNVTPVIDKDEEVPTLRGGLQTQSSVDEEYWVSRSIGISYQASSPDEIALVSWADEVGLALTKRDTTHMQLRTPHGEFVTFSILRLFPFKSETKRMGIIVRDETTKEITFYVKGADVVMKEIIYHQEWLDEEVANMAKKGLRTLVVAKKTLTEQDYTEFEAKYSSAEAVTANRAQAMAAVLANLEKNMDLVCITGVEDKLQDEVKETLETLRSAGIKIWMLTGDKLETAVCIAKSCNLVMRDQLFVFGEVTSTGSEMRTQVHDLIKAASRVPDAVLVITGDMLQNCLTFYEPEFTAMLCSAPSVVVCRCSPTQKSQVVELIRKHTKKRTAAIGDGGNDVSMIQAADVGIGIAGKEGKQASLAADFSITQFNSLQMLFLIHGRWSYKRSATLSQFVIHRGIIISVMQAIYSIVFYFSSVSLFPAPFMVGYATLFTMFPVFSLVLNKDFEKDALALKYPLLYKDLAKGRALSFKTFFLWVLVSVIQGGVIMYGTIVLFNDEMLHMVSIAFTALILTELIMVALTVTIWHYLIILAELVSLGLYFVSLFVFRSYFDPQFLVTWDFFWKVISITLFSCLPLVMGKIMCWWLSPSIYSKLS